MCSKGLDSQWPSLENVLTSPLIHPISSGTAPTKRWKLSCVNSAAEQHLSLLLVDTGACLCSRHPKAHIHHKKTKQSPQTSASRTLWIQVLASFRRQTAWLTFSLVQFSSISEHLKNSGLQQEHHQRVRHSHIIVYIKWYFSLFGCC